jgi:hypothetical protein
VLSIQAIYVEGFFLTHSLEVSLELAKFAKIHRKESAQDIFQNKKTMSYGPARRMACRFVMTGFFISFTKIKKGVVLSLEN